MNPRRLYRSRHDRQLAGVAGGMAEYLEVDPTVVRLLWILSVFLGGFTIPLVAAARPVGHLVFLCTAPTLGTVEAESIRALMVGPDLAAASRFRDEHGRALMAPADARRCFFDDCDDATADWAVARLRPQGARPMRDTWPVTRWPDAARHVIVARHDRAVSYGAALAAGRQILDGAEPRSLDGGHSPFLVRPAELGELLDEIVTAR